MTAVWASITAGQTGRPAEAERWADAVDRWQQGEAAWPADPAAEAWAAVLRAVMCRHGVKQMRTDADEAAQRLAAAGIIAPVAALCQGIAQVLSGDPEGGEAFFEEAIGCGPEAGAPDVLAITYCQQALLAMARGDWDQADTLASQA